MNAFDRLGLTSERLAQVGEQWVHAEQQSVTLRLEAEDSCSFVKDRSVDLPSSSVHTTATSGSDGASSTTKTSVSTKIKEHHWKVGVSYKLIIFKGSDPSADSVELQSRESSTVLITSGGSSKPDPPVPEKTIHPPIDVDLTWFFQRISPGEQVCNFLIDRGNKDACKTPRRNEDVDMAVAFDKSLQEWTEKVSQYFTGRIETDMANRHNPVNVGSGATSFQPGSIALIKGLQKEPTFNGKRVTVMEFMAEQQRYRVDPVDHLDGLPPTLLIKPTNLEPEKKVGENPPLDDLAEDQIFVPVLPLMEEGKIISQEDVANFLNEQNRSLDEALDKVAQLYPSRQVMKLISVAEASVVMICKHLQALTSQCHSSLDLVEEMLKTQMIQAIGKEINPRDFERFIRFRDRQFFGSKFAPKPFSYPIRRPNSFPEGLVSIETATPNTSPSPDEKVAEPIDTWARRISDGPLIEVPISAAVSVQIGGDRCLHGWMQHKFKSRTRPSSYQLVGRARQFSSFILMVGTIVGPDNTFEPRDAIIVQNKDQVIIPLVTNTLPSVKEFKDAIASLSPEQQEFANSVRAMQLESSLFGICVVQIKPQLEVLLGLPAGSLTKEIKLTQDLMDLFAEHQIPSDLLNFDGSPEDDSATKIAEVKAHVKQVMDFIEAEKQKQLKEETAKADMRAEMGYGYGAPDDGDQSSERGKNANKGRKMRRKSFAPGSGGSFDGSRPEPAPPKPAPVSSPPPSERQSRGRSVLGDDSSLGASMANLSFEDGESGEDFTSIPKMLDAKIEHLDTDSALRSTIIRASPSWLRLRQPNLLSPVASTALSAGDIDAEVKKALDMLEAISRCGTLPIHCAELHVVVGLSHTFDNDVLGSVLQDNINPITKVEKSSLMLAATVYGKPPETLLKAAEDVARLTVEFPELMDGK